MSKPLEPKTFASMLPVLSRRDFIKGVIAGGVAVSSGGYLFRASTLLAQSGLRVSRLGALTAAVLAAMPATAALAAVDGGEPRHERTLCTGRSDIPWDRQISSCTALPLSPLAPVINLFGRPGDDFARATR